MSARDRARADAAPLILRAREDDGRIWDEPSITEALLAAEQRGERRGFEMGRDAAAEEVDRGARQYPEDIFPDPGLGNHAATVDGCSAKALRVALPRWAEHIRALTHADHFYPDHPEDTGGGELMPRRIVAREDADHGEEESK